LAESDAQGVVCLRETRAQPGGLSQGVDGLVQPALLLQGAAQVEVGVGEVLVETDGLAQVGDGLVQPTLLAESAARGGGGPGAAWSKGQSHTEAADRFFPLLCSPSGKSPQRHTKAQLDPEVSRVAPLRVPQQGNRLLSGTCLPKGSPHP